MRGRQFYLQGGMNNEWACDGHRERPLIFHISPPLISLSLSQTAACCPNTNPELLLLRYKGSVYTNHQHGTRCDTHTDFCWNNMSDIVVTLYTYGLSRDSVKKTAESMNSLVKKKCLIVLVTNNILMN